MVFEQRISGVAARRPNKAKLTLCMPLLPSKVPVKPPIFSPETLESLEELGKVIRDVKRRLEAEGYIIKGRTYVAPKPKK